ncbi:MAG: hypothetical protein FD137_2382, partial [Spirochaetes bacterium]
GAYSPFPFTTFFDELINVFAQDQKLLFVRRTKKHYNG